jgi:hypothetical protein
LIATAHKVLVDSFDSLPAPVSMTGPVLTREAVQLAMQKEPRPLPISQVSAVWGTQLALSHADATAYPPLGNAPSVTTAEVVSEVLPVLSKADPLTAPQDFYSSVEVARQYQQVARYAPMALPHSPSSLLSLAQSTLTREQVPAPFGSVQAKQASLGWLMAHPMTPPYQMYDPAKSAYLVQLARKSIQSSKAGFVAPGDMTDVLQRIDALRVAVALVASFPDPMIPVSLGQVSSTLEVLAVAATYPDPLLPVSIEQVSDVVEAIAISSPYPDASEGVLYQVEELQVVTLMAGDYPDKDDPQTDYLTDALIEVVATTGTYIDKDEPQSTVTASSVSEVIAQGAAYPDKDSPQSTVSADAVAVVTSQSAAYEDKDTPHSLVASDYVGADVAVSAVYVDKDLPQSNGQTAGLAETIATRASYPPALAGYSTVQSDNVWLVMAQQAQYGPVDQFKRHQSVITVTYS